MTVSENYRRASYTKEELGAPEARYGIRHIQVLLLFFGMYVGYSSRIILSVAIVAMTDPTSTDNPSIPTYRWDDKSVILSAYNWGFVILQTLAGPIEKNFNLRKVFIASMVLNSLACMSIPLAAQHFGSWGVISLRFIQGFASGVLCPFVHTLLGRWVPPAERSRYGTFVYSGICLGAILAMIIAGMISSSWVGWPTTFYVFGIKGFVWVALFFFFGTSSPSEHRTISNEERHFIEKSLGQEDQKILAIPYKAILTSMPFWAILIANCGHDWSYNLLLTEIPNYLNSVINFDIKSNSLLSAAPYLALLLLCFVFGPVADLLINRNIFSRVTTRKIVNTIGLCVPAGALVALGYVSDDMPWLSVFTLIIAVGFDAGIYAGYQVNHIDLSPNHAGTLYGWSNGIGNICSFLGPLSVQAIVKNERDKSQWRIAFIIAAAINAISSVFYIFFAKGDVQYWNELHPIEKRGGKREKNHV